MSNLIWTGGDRKLSAAEGAGAVSFTISINAAAIERDGRCECGRGWNGTKVSNGLNVNRVGVFERLFELLG